MIRPHRIAVPDAELADLADRLERTRWPDQPDDTGWSHGAPVGYLRELAEYWRTGYDWRAHEARLNGLPQWMAEIDGAQVHLVHVRSPEPGALPLLLAHSWPGSLVEFLELIGPLTDPRAHGGDPADAFHVVVPSMPGFGFSGPTTAPWTMTRVARPYGELMRRLGHPRYAAHGGDFGSEVCRELGAVDPEHVVALHVTHVFSASADPGDATEPRSAAAAARPLGLRRAAVHPAAVGGLRPHRLPGGPAGLDRRAVPGLDRRERCRRRGPGGRGRPGPAADERDALLADPYRGIVGALLQGGVRPAGPAVVGADGGRGVPARRRGAGTTAGRAGAPHRPVDRVRPWWALACPRRARSAVPGAGRR